MTVDIQNALGTVIKQIGQFSSMNLGESGIIGRKSSGLFSYRPFVTGS